MLRLLPHVLVMILVGGIAYWLTRSRTVAAVSATIALVAMLVLGLAI